MVRSLALLAGLAAVAPAFAGEMSVDEARHFVVGKTFYYTCFEGTHGKGRVFADGSVVGSVQFQGNGPMRFAALPAGTLLGTTAFWIVMVNCGVMASTVKV